jgi:hypothetical protein
MLEAFYRYIRAQRLEHLRSIEFFGSGHGGTHSVHDGVTVDTTASSIARLREQVSELEQVLRDAGVPLD